VAVVVLFVAGCGGSSGDKSASKSASEKNARAAFIAKADAICAKTQRQQAQLARQAKGRSLTEVVPLLHQQARLAKSLAKQLRALTPPPADEVPVKKFIFSVNFIGVLSSAAADSIQAGHQLPTQHIKDHLLQVSDREHALGQGYGFKVCASGKGY